MQSGPWWGAALIAGISAFLGVLTAQAVAIRIERQRERRDDLKHWHKERLEIYSQFLAQVHLVIQSFMVDQAGETMINHELNKNRIALQTLFTQVRFMGSSDTINTATGIMNLVDQLIDAYNKGYGSGYGNKFTQLVAIEQRNRPQMLHFMDAFFQSAQREIYNPIR